jgi:hypothetical protein
MANIASGNTDKVNDRAVMCSLPAITKRATSDNCCGNKGSPGPLSVQLSSLYSESKICPGPTPAEFALYPKVAVASSVRTLEKVSALETCSAPGERFAKYKRWQPPLPCPPLPQIAQSAGISKPSTRACNLQTFY